MSACPTRATLYSKLGNNEQEVESEMKEWLEAFGSLLAVIKKELQTKGLEK